ncbi:MAG: poly-gamma-glutamate synthase PgsB [FCB group bacterium]|nr:poly-gamma-glutamate synthase PgsB [FCB group bacterium]
MLIITIVLFLLIGIWTTEYLRHQHNLRKIPIRIHVNGTRGKSSVTRLIAAGLRAGGLKTLAKTTGTLPRIIDEEGLEIPVPRPKMVNIIEQLDIVKFMSRRNPDAMVMECMAVQPEYQWICEHRMIKSTIGVITNARMDHVREMGPNIYQISRSLANTLPRNGVAFTSSKRSYPAMLKVARKLNTELTTIPSSNVTSEELAKFSYIEHPGNVCLALAVCEHLGIGRQTALDGMYKSHPDVGAMKIFKVKPNGGEIYFINALAANDPESTLEIWRNLDSIFKHRSHLSIMLNTRADRFDRSIQLLEMIAAHIKFDELVLVGQKVDQVVINATRLKIPRKKITALGINKAEEVYKSMADNSAEDGLTIVYAIGNMGQGGLKVAEYFKNQAQVVVDSENVQS